MANENKTGTGRKQLIGEAHFGEQIPVVKIILKYTSQKQTL
jgi:hypothetical protein